MWILVKNETFENVNFVKNETLKMWILRKWDFEIVNFWMICGFLPQCDNDDRFRMKSQFLKRQQYIPSTVENTGALSSPGRHSRQGQFRKLSCLSLI